MNRRKASQAAVIAVLSAAAVLAGCGGGATRLESTAGAMVRGTPLTRPAGAEDAPAPRPDRVTPPRPQAEVSIQVPGIPSTPAPGLREFFPGVRVDAAAKVVEFDAAVSPMLVPDAKAPLFYLEVIVCTPDTREHETLFITRARPSHVHAAMLLAGLAPGEPGGWKLRDDRLIPIDPTGDRVTLRAVYQGPGGPVEVDPRTWVVNTADGRTILERPGDEPGRPAPGWVFAGSRLVDRPGTPGLATVYDADESGIVVGLATFGAEVIAWSRTFSPDADIAAPEWIAKIDETPPAGTPVIIRLGAETAR